MKADYDVIILGGGATGLSAALYSVRAMMKTLVLESVACGGQILYTDVIENYPGFPDGITGPELSKLYEKQAQKFGAEVQFEQVESLDIGGPIKLVKTSEGEHTGRTVIIAMGGSHKKLGVPGEEEFSGRGVSYCATCDGNFFRGQDVTVVGGGDSAIDEGLYLTRIVNKVTVIHRRDQLRASKVLQERAFATPNMEFTWNTVVQEIQGNGAVEKLLVKNSQTGEIATFPTDGLFVYIGFVPNSQFLQGVVSLDGGGHVVTNIRMETEVPGVFAAGDIRQHSDRQLGTAVGDGITAVLSAYRYLTEG